MAVKPFLLLCTLVFCSTIGYAGDSTKSADTVDSSDAAWQALSEEQRSELIKRYQDLHQVPAEDRSDLQQRMDWFSQLPKEKQQHMREVWQNMSSSEREYWKNKLKQASPDQREALREKILAKYDQ